jgi:uncharacterized protein (TIGR02001 family)
MKKTLSLMMALSSLAVVSQPAMAEGMFDAENFSASVGLTSNYLFRGITLSDDDAAISGSLDWSYNGFYVGTWGSSIDAVESETMELDYYAGYVGEVAGLTYSVDFLYYDYPGEDGSPTDDLAYYEFGGSLSYTFDVDYAPTAGILVLHSPDFYGETGSATAYESSLSVTLPADIGLGVHYGVQELDSTHYDPDSYTYYGIDLTKSIGKFDFTVGYSDTDSDGEAFQGSETDEFYISVGASI